jgi:ATP-dependent 26S proteasome regulatory subunit
MAGEDVKPVRLQVANARPEDSGHGIARLPRSSMAALGVQQGDVIEIIGKKSTAARAVLPYDEDVVATSGQMPVDRGDMPPQLRQMLAAPAYSLQEIRLLVVEATPKGIVQIDAETEVELLSEYVEPKDARRADVTYDDVGGMADTIDQLREMVELPLRYPELFTAARRRSAQGGAAARPAGHRQDPAGARGRQ